MTEAVRAEWVDSIGPRNISYEEVFDRQASSQPVLTTGARLGRGWHPTMRQQLTDA